MIIVRLQGGLGNQMFQYALGRSLAIKNNTELGLDLTFLLDRTPIPNFTFRNYDLDVFDIKAKIVKKKDIPFLYRKYSLGILMRYIDYIRRKLILTPGKEKKHYSFDPKIIDLGPSVYLEGWWQSYKYFSNIEDTIRKDFTIKYELPQNIMELCKQIEKEDSVCVHIRRGDYVGNKNYEVLDNNYYSRGIELLKNKVKIYKIYVFSDDITWCIANVKFDFPTIYVNDSYRGSVGEGHMILMSCCKYFIIANSSFSWWGAWLATNPNKVVICPKQWFGDKSIDTSDLIPENWVRI